MAAQDHVSPKQLKMFMSAREILDDVDMLSDDKGAMVSLEGIQRSAMLQFKAKRAADSGLAEHIAASGVKKPLDIVHGPGAESMLANGHHRLVIQANLDPDALMPVMHHDRFSTLDPESVDTDPTGDKPYHFGKYPK